MEQPTLARGSVPVPSEFTLCALGGAVNRQYFPDNAAGKLSFGMMVLLAKYYVANFSDEVKKCIVDQVQEGSLRHQAPLGCVNARDRR